MTDYLWKRPGSAYWQLRVPVPSDVQSAYGRREFTKSMREHDRSKAAVKSWPVLQALNAEWDSLREQSGGSSRRGSEPTDAELHEIARDAFELSAAMAGDRRVRVHAEGDEAYEDYLVRQERLQTAMVRQAARGDLEPWMPAAERMASRAGYAVDREAPWFKKLAGMLAEVTLAATDRENRLDRGELSPEPSSGVLKRAETLVAEQAAGRKDIAFSDLVKAYMVQWRAGSGGSKETNTEAQKLATFRLFEGYWKDQPVRGVRAEHAAEFRDTIKLLEPTWSRSPAARKLPWAKLVEQFGNRAKGLSAATMNRHMAALKSLWRWAEKRGHCDGSNPFDDFHVKLRSGVNVAGYLPWETAELNRLFDPPPKRDDLREIMIVGMFSGMRLDEIASLTWGRLRTEGKGEGAIAYFDVDDAKTLAGIRQVPVHPALGWLLRRTRGDAEARIWPDFNGEGPGKKAGADAGREFSRFKTGCGFLDRQKVFHSFRKNVVGQLERLSVPESEVAQLVGHEKGFTFGRYGAGISLERKAEIISRLVYVGVNVPHPAK